MHNFSWTSAGLMGSLVSILMVENLGQLCGDGNVRFAWCGDSIFLYLEMVK